MVRYDQKYLPRVTFIIPTLNAMHYLPRCVTAIKNQDYPPNKIEIIITDGGSTDDTLEYCLREKLKIIHNPDILHEPGKSLAAKKARGEIIFYTDADNILAVKNWVRLMIKPILDGHTVMGFLPQMVPPPDSSGLNRYLGYLYTDPFTWFVYQNLANPYDYQKVYLPVFKHSQYLIFKFNPQNLPLFGLSQGVGTFNTFKRTGQSRWDDLIAGINLIKAGGLVAYIPQAEIYHYHVSDLSQFISKYSWRIRNNLSRQYQNMGFLSRKNWLSPGQKLRSYLFILYALSVILPIIDSVRLCIKYRDPVMFWHIPASFILAILIIINLINKSVFGSKITLGQYE